MVPSAKTLPEACELVRVTPAQLSAAVGAVQDTVALQEPLVLPVVMFAGIPAMVGAVLSTTVITCVAVAVLPAASVAVQVTVVLPSGKAAGALLVTVTVPQSTLATGDPRLGIVAWQLEFALTVKLVGAVMLTLGLTATLVTCS